MTIKPTEEVLVSNRGSVSEDILAREIYSVREKIHGHYPDSGPFDELPAMQKDWLLREARGLLQIFTIQQAVSECSGGGADGFHPGEAWRDLVEKDDRTSPGEYPDMCLITRAELFDYMKRALPLPPLP